MSELERTLYFISSLEIESRVFRYERESFHSTKIDSFGIIKKVEETKMKRNIKWKENYRANLRIHKHQIYSILPLLLTKPNAKIIY